MSLKVCSVEGCSRDQYSNGLCIGHNSRMKRDGDVRSHVPLQHRYYDPDEGFKARTEWAGECLEWVGWRTPDGYGKFKMNGKHVPAHRYAWESKNGPIPAGMEIDHICHNPACCNVSHLRLATREQNLRNLSGPASDNKYSKVRNVGRAGKRWRVRVTKDGTVHYFGTYDTVNEAAEVAEQARRKLFGEFAGKG